MITLGITGNSGSGKSVAASRLRGFGASVIDADELAHIVIKRGEAAYDELVALFGRGILGGDGEINRRRLGEIVFADRELLNRLEEVTHRHIKRRIMEAVAEAERLASPLLVIDAPLLLESGLGLLCDYVIIADAPAEQKIRRITLRDGISEAQALARLDKQRKHRDNLDPRHYYIENGGSESEFLSKIDEIWEELSGE